MSGCVYKVVKPNGASRSACGAECVDGASRCRKHLHSDGASARRRVKAHRVFLASSPEVDLTEATRPLPDWMLDKSLLPLKPPGRK
jgi:hypothetical protein